uniref:Uncharacterized protein n=1 Tax=Aspergillus heteromorphus alternavirus 1 TaxID=2501287 RepID=A0A3Q9NMY1_9VIRU|nr:hypothetical protein AheAV1_s2gp1 [Aspergillus heteromorphus alternavirus 1]
MMLCFNVLVDPRSGRPDAGTDEACSAYEVEASPEGDRGWSLRFCRRTQSQLTERMQDLSRSGDYYTSRGAYCAWRRVREGVGAIRVNKLMVFIHRFVGSQAGMAPGAIPVSVHLVLSERRTVNFSVDVPTGLAFPGGFNYNFAEATLDDFGSPHEPIISESALCAGVPGSVAQFSDEVLGDVAVSVSGFPVSADSPTIPSSEFRPKVRPPPPLSLGPLADGMLARGDSGHAKMQWLGSCFLNLLDPDGRALVGGDHPGSLSRHLLQAGVDVVGVDPRNVDSYQGPRAGCAPGSYTQVSGRLHVNSCLDDYGHDWGGVFMDIGGDADSAEADTAVNLGLLRRFLDAGTPVGIAKARSAPRVPGAYGVLANPGWEVRGCETYLWATQDSRPPDPDARTLFSLLVFEDRPFFHVFVPDASLLYRLCAMFFDFSVDANAFVVPVDDWYYLVNLRAFVFSSLRNSTGLGEAILGARCGVDAWQALESYFGATDLRVRMECSDRFRSADPHNARGVSRSLIAMLPGLDAVMAARYSTLLTLCVDPGIDCPDEVGYLMRHPGSGALLADLSQLRTLMDETQPRLAEYSRVIPWNSMAILASEMFFRLVYWLCLSTTRVYRPMHAWELQHMLWSLSNHGTDAERFLYLYDRFSRIFTGVDQARSYSRKSGSAERALTNFQNNLDALGIRDRYLDFDAGVRNVILSRGRPARGRVMSSASRRPSDSVSVRSVTTLTHSVLPEESAQSQIIDLSVFGQARGWGSTTSLRTVLSATDKRVDKARAYAYWCTLSSVVRPAHIPRARWRPPRSLLSPGILALHDPAFPDDASMVRYRDAELRKLVG